MFKNCYIFKRSNNNKYSPLYPKRGKNVFFFWYVDLNCNTIYTLPLWFDKITSNLGPQDTKAWIVFGKIHKEYLLSQVLSCGKISHHAHNCNTFHFIHQIKWPSGVAQLWLVIPLTKRGFLLIHTNQARDSLPVCVKFLITEKSLKTYCYFPNNSRTIF